MHDVVQCYVLNYKVTNKHDYRLCDFLFYGSLSKDYIVTVIVIVTLLAYNVKMYVKQIYMLCSNT